MLLVIAGLGLPLPALASPACQPCHAARVQAQSATPHARALSRYGGEHFAGRKVNGRGGAQFSYSRRELTLSRGSQNVTTPVEWAFGSGVQAVTLLVSRGGQWVEHRLSWYRAGDRLGLTPGHDPAPPFDLEEEIGIVQTARNAERCFQCHRPNSEPGVHCQACHGEGAGHRDAPSGANIRRDRSVALCASCHRSPDATYAAAEPELEDPRSIRFAPVGFLASRCAQKSPGFTCVACHDPHGEPPRSSVNAVCQGCHGATRSKCPRTDGACAGCHLKRSSPIPALSFTDHRIRVF